MNGTELKQNGEIYKGQFYNKKRHGIGECFLHGRLVRQGQWDQGKLVRTQEEVQKKNRFEDANLIGQSELDGKNARLRFGNNQELSLEELMKRQMEMNNFVLENDDAVEMAMREHERALEEIQNSFDNPKLLYDEDCNLLEDFHYCQTNCLANHQISYEAFTQKQR